MELSFAGNVEKETVDRLLGNNQTLSGRIEGDFRAVIDTRASLKSSFNGKLAGDGLRFLSLLPEPIDVGRFSIHGSGRQLKIDPSEISLCGSRLIVDGVLDNSSGNLDVDLNVDADQLDEELVRALFSPGKDKAEGSNKPGDAQAIHPRGVIHVKANNFTYGGHTWSPVQADVHVDGNAARVRVGQANLCGISTLGVLGFSPQGVSLRISLTANDAPLQETIKCLWHKPVNAAALYDLTGEISLPPSRENPARSLSGHVEFSSENGNIAYANVLMKIFSVLNVTEVFTGGRSDLSEDGYGYAKAYAKAQIDGGKVQIEEILVDGNSLKITGQGNISLGAGEADITLLAAPLKTIDRIVNKIPVINYIAGGSLITIPLRLTGPLTDIKVKPIRPSAVGEGVLNIMERTLKAPFKLVQGASEFVVEESSRTIPRATESPADGP
jgi:hypothetical protein